MKLQFLQFKQSIKSALDGLFHHDFLDGEVAAFELAMARAVDVLRSQGHVVFAKRELSVPFLSLEKMAIPSTNLNDTWKFSLHCEVVGIALNTEMAERMPWELLIYG